MIKLKQKRARGHRLMLASLLLLFSGIATAQTWHVAVTGNDSADGRSAKTAFRTLQKAAAVVKAGDVVAIGSGEYTNDDRSGGSAVLNISVPGTKEAPITWKAAPGATR
jgi:hypothetical protein